VVDVEAIGYSARDCTLELFSVCATLVAASVVEERMRENCNYELTVRFYAPLFELSGWEELHCPAVFELTCSLPLVVL